MATFSVDGFTWEAQLPKPGADLPTRAEAEAALEALSLTALQSKYGRAAAAALKVADYGQCVSCCAAAEEAADPERWS